MQLCRKPAALESILKVASMFSGYFKEKHSLIRIFYPKNMQPLQGSERRLSKHRTDYCCCCCCCRDCDAWDKRHNIWNKPGSEVWQLFHSPTRSLSGSIKPWKMTGTCVHWWTRLRLAKCKNCLQVKSPLYSTNSSTAWLRRGQYKDVKSHPQQGPLIRLILCWKWFPWWPVSAKHIVRDGGSSYLSANHYSQSI